MIYTIKKTSGCLIESASRKKEEIRKFAFECVYYGLMDELDDEGRKKNLGYLLNRAIDYLDEIGLNAENYKSKITDTLQEMIDKEKK